MNKDIIPTVHKFLSMDWTYEQIAKQLKIKDVQALKNLLKYHGEYREEREVHIPLESPIIAVEKPSKPIRTREAPPIKHHLSQSEIIDHEWYPNYLKNMKKEEFKPTHLPEFSLREDHWLKPHLNKEIFIHE